MVKSVGLAENPTIHEWMRPEEVTFRENARANLTAAISQGQLPGGNPKILGAYDEGESSAVFLVGTDEGKKVAKMAVNPDAMSIEHETLAAWASTGAVVPATVLLGSYVGLKYPILLLEYVSSPQLSKAIPMARERIGKGISRKMGETLSRMHQVHAYGFGRPTVGNIVRGGIETFSSFAEATWLGKQVPYLLGQKVITAEDVGMAERAVGVFSEKTTTPNALLHDDYFTYNLFYNEDTKRLIVFDPHPLIGPPEIDLALTSTRALVDDLSDGVDEVAEIVAGYGEIDSRRLSAAMVLRSISLASTHHHKGRSRKVQREIEIMRQYAKRMGP